MLGVPFWGLVYLGLWFLPFALASPLATTELAPAHGSAALRASLPKLPARDRSARSAAVDYSENWAGAVLDSYPTVSPACVIARAGCVLNFMT
jgi:hypothetical protein